MSDWRYYQNSWPSLYSMRAYANCFWSPLLLILSRTKLLWFTTTCRTTYEYCQCLNYDNDYVHSAMRARCDESLIIIIHKILLWESARRETKQERCAAKQEGMPSLLRGLLMSSSSPLAGNWSIPRREGGVLESVEQKPNHFRRLRPLGRRDADVGWRTPFLFASRSLYCCSSLVVSISLYWTYHPLGLRPTSKQTADLLFGKRSHGSFFNAANDVSRIFFLFTGFFRFCSLISRVSCRSLFPDCYKDSGSCQDNLPLLYRVHRV